jgi:hypothetical protein
MISMLCSRLVALSISAAAADAADSAHAEPDMRLPIPFLHSSTASCGLRSAAAGDFAVGLKRVDDARRAATLRGGGPESGPVAGRA